MADRNLPEVWEVEWVDSTGEHGWSKDKGARELREDVATTVGFLVTEDKERVVMTPSTIHMPEGEFGHHARFDCVQAIPRCAIRKMRRVRQARS